jgi:hypothetical protein
MTARKRLSTKNVDWAVGLDFLQANREDFQVVDACVVRLLGVFKNGTVMDKLISQ